MMDPKKYDELIEQQDYYCQKYEVEIILQFTTGPDSKHSTELHMHSAAMTVTGDSYIARNSPIFRSDDKGAFYRQIDALLNARIKLVDWLKEIDAKNYMSSQEERFLITGGEGSVNVNGSNSEYEEYVAWLSMRRREFTATQ
ncbi:hypothetical protein NHQ30_003294 [Ciborinia camelliae]|nr:hypothetical protein NHQ30_003294 [Ciborinia camelliae]